MSREILDDISPAVELCCLLNSWSPTRFGREFNGDPNFVRELKKSRSAKRGRKLRSATRKRLIEFLNEYGVELEENT